MTALPQPHPAAPPAPLTPDAPELGKRSFLKLPVAIDVEALRADYRALPKEAWKVSHWEAHCSSDMVLLRGGQKGMCAGLHHPRGSQRADFLHKLPVPEPTSSRRDGPFGQATYAFIFRMKPMGVAQPHLDDDPAWHAPFRIHLPAHHQRRGARSWRRGGRPTSTVGEAWTFDNQVRSMR